MKRKGNFNLKLMGALMAVGIIFTPTSWAGGFSDTSQSEYANAIENLYNKGAINGYSDGLFRPDNTLTKEEGASLIYSSFHLMPVYVLNSNGENTNSETDVQELDGCKLKNRTSVYYRNAIMKYIREKGEINPKIEGRIEILNPQETSQKLG